MQGAIRYLSGVGIIAMFEIGPFAPGPEAWPALFFPAVYKALSLNGWDSKGRELAETLFHCVGPHNYLQG